MSQACKYKSLCNCLHFPRRIRTRRSLLIFPTHSCHFTRTALARLNDGSAPACIAAVISSHMYLPFWPHLDCASNTSEEKMNLKNVPSVHASLQFMVYNPLGFLSPPHPLLGPTPLLPPQRFHGLNGSSQHSFCVPSFMFKVLTFAVRQSEML